MKSKNPKATVATKATGKQGGTNAPVKAVKKPTGKTGGVNVPPAGATPMKKYGGASKGMMKKGGMVKSKKM